MGVNQFGITVDDFDVLSVPPSVVVYGPPGCIAGDAHVRYTVMTPDGRRQNTKGGSLQRLYERFNRLPRAGKGSYQRPQTENSHYFIQSVDENERVFLNKVTAVVDSGEKPVFQVTTRLGFTLKATDDHEFRVIHGYRQLRDLVVGDHVMVNTGKVLSRGGRNKRDYRPEVLVKYHPYGSMKKVEDKYVYYRLRLYRVIYEAHLNGLSYDDYVKLLNTGTKAEIDKLRFVMPDFEVHHINGDHTDNSIDNLTVLSHEEHARLHAERDEYERISIYAQPDPIVSIEYVGVEHVYDVQVADPHRNFVANGVVVHNCGKSFEMARTFPRVLYVQSSPSILHALADYATKGGKVTIPERVTIDERTVAQHYNNSTITAVVTIVERYIAACDSGKAPWEGIVFDEWNVLCERMFAELKTDPWGRFKGRSGAINIFAVMDAFKGIHRSVISLARRTRKVVGFVSHHQSPKIDEEENSPTKGLIKWRGGPKMPMGLSDQMVELCADADVVLQLTVEEQKGDLMAGTPGTTQRKFLTALDEKWFRKVRGFVDPIEPLDVKNGHGLRELLTKAGYKF